MGDQWAVPIWAAIIAAFAAIIVALLNARREGKDTRARIVQDLEILNTMNTRVMDPVILTVDLQQRIDRLAVESYESRSRLKLVLADLIGLLAASNITWILVSEEVLPTTGMPVWAGILGVLILSGVFVWKADQYMTHPKRAGDAQLKPLVDARDNAREELKAEAEERKSD